MHVDQEWVCVFIFNIIKPLCLGFPSSHCSSAFSGRFGYRVET